MTARIYTLFVAVAAALLTVAGSSQAQAQNAAAPQPKPHEVSIALSPLTVYTIDVTSAAFRPSAVLFQPPELDTRNADGSVKGFFYTGEHSFSTSSAPNAPVVHSSKIRVMPEPNKGGVYRLNVSSGDGKPVTDYTITIHVATTR